MELKQAGTTIIFISHDLRAVQQLCDRVILLNKGRIEADGDPAQTIASYQSASQRISVPANSLGTPPSGEAVVTSLSFYDERGNECLSFDTGTPLKAVLNYRAYEPLEDVIFEVQFFSQENRLCSFFSSETLGELIDLQPGEGSVTFDCSAVGLGPGMYFVDAGIRNRLAPFGIDIDWRRRCVAVRVDYDRHLRDTFYMPYVVRHTPPIASELSSVELSTPTAGSVK
jgi:lipopolysaccharide transport system ATP-binding protein